MLDDIAAIEADALPRIAAAATLDELRALEQELLGKKSVLSSFKAKLGGLDDDGRREVGGALNRVRDALEAALSARRGELEQDARRVQLQAERLDLTEVPPTTGPVTSTSSRSRWSGSRTSSSAWASPSPRAPRSRPTGTTSAR